MEWKSYIKGFEAYLMLERSLSPNSIEAYVHDVEKLVQFLVLNNIKTAPQNCQCYTVEKLCSLDKQNWYWSKKSIENYFWVKSVLQISYHGRYDRRRSYCSFR